MKKKIAKTNAARKAAEDAIPGRSVLISDARDAEGAVRAARIMMSSVSCDLAVRSATWQASVKFERQAEALEEDARSIMKMLSTAPAAAEEETPNEPPIEDTKEALAETDGMLHAHAVPVHGPAYLVKLNQKAAANLERLARDHGIAPEEALTVAALVMVKCGSGDCWVGDCFKDLLQETNEQPLQFIEAAGSGRNS